MTPSTDTSRIVPLPLPSREGSEQLWRRELVLQELDYLTIPPSPIRIRLIATICAVFATALLIAAIVKIDIYAVAEAHIHPTGRSKIVQPLATGRVSAIYVVNGSEVRKGDLLLQLDPTEATAERTRNAERYNALNAEVARRTATNTAIAAGQWASNPEIIFDVDTPVELQARERRVLAADLANLRAQIRALDARIVENTTRRNAVQATIAQQERLVAVMQKRYDMTQALLNDKLAPRVSLIEAEQSLAIALTDLAEWKGQLQSAEASVRSSLTEKQHAIALFTATNMQALADVQEDHDEVAQSLVKASARSDYTRLVAPIDGVVQDVAVTTIGQVVASGQHLFTIVPNDSPLEIEALVSNRDIGFVENGQHAVLKLDAFPFTRYGTLSGKVIRISRDSIDRAQALSLATNSALDNRALPVGQAQNLVYAVTAALDRNAIIVDDRAIPLLPGMTGRVEIRTGERRAIEYFLAPLLEVVSEAGHER